MGAFFRRLELLHVRTRVVYIRVGLTTAPSIGEVILLFWAFQILFKFDAFDIVLELLELQNVV